MFDDFGQYNLDRLNSKEIKSQDVLKKHSLDPTLEDDPILKASTILSSGDELQKFSVLLSFPDLFRRNSSECFKVLVPKMQQSLPGASVDYHMLASSAVRTLLQDRIISPDMFVSNFLHTILTAMDSKDITVSSTWSETLYDVLDYLPPKILQTDILPVIIGKLDVNVPIPTRIISCKILKQLIKYCDSTLLRRDLVPLVVTLCQDVSSDVRGAGCGPLAALASAAGPDVLKSHLMNALVDVASDDSPGVRQAAFPTVISVCPLMPIEMLRNTGIPLVVKFVKLALRNNENLTSTISENFGTMCLSLERGLTLNEKEEYFLWYQSLTSLGNHQCQVNRTGIGIFFDHKVSFDKLVDIREYGADNFILMTKFTKGDIDKKFCSMLAESFRCMVSDPSSCIRRKIATIFSEVLSFYGKNATFMKQELNILLTDSSDEVLEAIVPQISQLVDEFVKYGIYKVAKDMYVLEFVSSLMKCESTLCMSHRWRSYVSLLSQMEILCRGFNTEAIAANFLPLLWKRLTSIRNLQNRKAVFRLIIVILRMSKKEQTRYEIINRITNELCMSNSFYNRMLFMRCCPILNEIFSTKFVKQNFINNILLMAEDSVANVRWAFVSYLPFIKGMLTAEDKQIIDQMNHIVDKLTYDADAEVRRQLGFIAPQLISADKDKMYPDDKKKYEMEMLLFAGKKVEQGMPATSAVNPPPSARSASKSVPESQRTRQFNNNPHARSPNPSVTSKSSSQHRQDSEVVSLSSVSRTSGSSTSRRQQ